MSKRLGRRSDKTVSEYRDSAGMRLDEYPRPSVAVDTAVMTVTELAELAVLQVSQPERAGWRLPGTFLHEGERLIDAVHRSLLLKAGIEGLAPHQLHVFDDPVRDDRGWVLSVAHVDVVPIDRLAERDRERTRLIPVARPGRLPYGHGSIVALAVADLRQRYAMRPDPGGLLPSRFTLRQLRLVHEAVAGEPLQRDTFRRAMEPFLTATGDTVVAGRGRPAELFTRSDIGGV